MFSPLLLLIMLLTILKGGRMQQLGCSQGLSELVIYPCLLNTEPPAVLGLFLKKDYAGSENHSLH
jgi:hypothetical protein